MRRLEKLTIQLLAGVIAVSAAGATPDFPYCDVPLDLPENALTSEMTLLQLQVVIRHGDRTPGHKIPVEAGTVPWECEPFASTLRFLDVSPQAVDQEIDGPFSFPPSCSADQLTTIGVRQQLELGAAMREKYVGRLEFLPPALTTNNQGEFLFRSTDFPRTRQSGQAFLVGLYPPSRRIGNPILPLRIRDMDFMAPDGKYCPKLIEVYEEYPKSELFARTVEDNLAAVQSVGKAIGTWHAGDDPKAAFVATTTAADNLFARVCHGKELPEGVNLENLGALRPVTDQYAAGFSTFDRPGAARLIIGRFLGEIRDTMGRANEEEPAPRMALYSAHDFTLWSLLATLVEKNDVLVPYASHLAFELWRDDQGEAWVSTEFNGAYLTVGDCPSSLCPLDIFLDTTEKYVPVNIEKECQATPTAPGYSD